MSTAILENLGRQLGMGDAKQVLLERKLEMIRAPTLNRDAFAELEHLERLLNKHLTELELEAERLAPYSWP